MLVMGGYVVIIGIGAFLEKPALQGLDALQLNGLMFAMTVVAVVAFAVEGPRMPMSSDERLKTRDLGGLHTPQKLGSNRHRRDGRIGVAVLLPRAAQPARLGGRGNSQFIHCHHGPALDICPAPADDQNARWEQSRLPSVE
jgi:hypothetical protein